MKTDWPKSKNNFNQNMEIIITDELAVSYFKQKKIKIQKFVSNIFIKYFSELFEIDLIRDLFYKLKILLTCSCQIDVSKMFKYLTLLQFISPF